MRQKIILSVMLFVLFPLLFSGNSVAATYEENLSQAVQSLCVRKGDANFLLLTNAPYVKVDSSFALPYLEKAQEQTGCTVGKGNLLFFQRAQDHPLRLMLFDKTNGNAVIISKEEKQWVSEKLNMSPAEISKPSFWEKSKGFFAGKDMFTLAAIADVWAEGGPYDFLKSAELHNHICPGLTSGYLIAHYIQNHYPLKEGERYTIIASPTWCKEDALQVLLDCTPGKQGMVVKHLSKVQIDRISFADPAGIVLVWDEKRKVGKGYALAFDFKKLKALSPKDSPKAATVLSVLPHLTEPDRFVTTAAEFDLNEGLYDGITQAGENPYELAGLIKN